MVRAFTPFWGFAGLGVLFAATAALGAVIGLMDGTDGVIGARLLLSSIGCF